MWMAGPVVALIVTALIAWWMVDQARAQQVGGDAGERPALLLGNESLPPMNFLKYGKPTGIVIDLAEALAERMHHPAEIRLINWTEAQQLVLEGRADALLQINPSPERLEIYDFSEPLLTSEFSIFTAAERLGITSMRDLRGLKVGVEEKGLPILLLQEDPEIIVEIIPDFVQGFRMLTTGALDAVIADRWVGSYVLAENKIRGVKLIEEPIGRSNSAIAVKKGNTNLLEDINAALADIRRDGTYDRIIKSWRSREVVFETREQLRQQEWLVAVILAALTAALVGVAVLAGEIRRRKRIEATLRESEAKYRTLFENMTEEVHFWQVVRDEAGQIKTWRLVDANPPTLSTWGRTSLDEIREKTTDEIFGPGAADHYMPVVQKIITEGIPYSFEDYFPNLDKYFKFTSVPLGDYFVTTGADITSIKKAEQALRQKETELKEAQRIAHMGSWYWDAKTDVTTGTDVLLRIYGFDPATQFMPDFREQRGRCYPVEEWERVNAAVQASLTTGIGYELDVQAIRDGEPIWVTTRSEVVRDLDGQIVGLRGAVQDITERKRMEDELRESEEFKRRVIESSPDCIKVLDLEGNLLSMSSTGQRLLEIDDLTQYLNTSWIDFWQESDRTIVAEAVATARVGGKGQFQAYCPSAMGKPMWWEVVVTPIPDAKGTPERLLAISREITERKRAEEELRDAHDKLELRVRERTAELVSANEDLQKQATLLDLSHDAIFVVDSADVVSSWNKGAEDLYGFTREQAIGKVACEFLQTRFPESLERVVSQVIDKGQWAGELRHTTSGGKEIVVESRWALRSGEDGRPAAFLEVNRDITSRKVVEERLRKADRAFRTLSECNQAVIRQTEEMQLLHDICRTVVEVGGYRMAWVGFAEHDEKKTVRAVAHAGYDDGYLEKAGITWADEERGRGPTGASIRTGETCISKNALQNPLFEPWLMDARPRGYASSIALPLVVEGKITGALTMYAPEPDAFDEQEVVFLRSLAENLAYGITSIRSAIERRRSEEALKVYTERLELVNAELQEFTFVAAHDLQEPLRKIQTFCDIAIKRCAPVLDDTSQDYLNRVVSSASRMRELLRDLLEFSRVAVNPEPLKKIDLVKVVREAADVFEETAKNTGALVEIENIPAIEADESQMLRLFQNLIGNALKFHGGDIPRIKVYGTLDKKSVCEIFVKDNGIGFKPKFAELIFKPFQRLHGRSEYDGTGMGLAICRKIVERHGGNIRAESEPGKGTTFIIRLPAKQNQFG